MTGNQEDNDIIYFDGRKNGLTVVHEWSVLLSTKDTLVVYSCIGALGQESESVLVLSSTPTLNNDHIPRVSQSLAKISLNFDDLCELNPVEDCAEAPEPFMPYEKREPPSY